MANFEGTGNNSAEELVFDNLGFDPGQVQDQDAGDDDDDRLQPDSEGQDDDAGGQDDADDFISGQLQSRDKQQQDGRQPSRVSHTPDRSIPPSAEVKPDRNGNLVNADGRVVARAGREARLYQENFRNKRQLQTSKTRVTELEGRLQQAIDTGNALGQQLRTLQGNSEALKQFNMTADDQLTAYKLFSELRKDPAAAIKRILTRARANGINIDDAGTTGGVDPKSLVDLVRDEIGKVVKPIQDRNAADQEAARQAQEDKRLQDQINQEVFSFFSENPEAQRYGPVFEQMVQRFPRMSLGEIWARIQLNLHRRGRTPSSRGSLPSGRRALPGNRDEGMAPVKDSYDSILRGVLDKHGIS